MAIVILEHSADCSAELLMDSLRTFGQRLRVVRLHAGQAVPADLDDVHGLISLGGSQTVHALDAPWMRDEMNLLREAHGARVPVLGLCLGAQLLAAALGGETGAMAAPEIGWKSITLSAQGCDDALFAGHPWQTPQLCWHRDQVTKLPEGATLLASSEACKVQAYCVGYHSYALQYHCEWSAATMQHHIETSDADLKAAGVSAQTLQEETTRNAPTSARLAKRFFDAINTLVMPADRQNRGIVKDMHH